MNMRHLHRLTAFGLIAFVALHLGNHLTGVLAGPTVHLATQKMLALIYRAPLIEPVLLGAIGIQIFSGIRMLGRRGWPRMRHAQLQSVSGGYLAVFLVIHISAVMQARWVGLDTDLYFAAAGLHAGGLWLWFFVPYYGLALLAVGAHLTLALLTRAPRRRTVVWAGAGLTTCVTLSIILLLAGVLHPMDIPAENLAQYQ